MPAVLAFALLAVAYLALGLANFVSGDAADTLSKIGGWVLLADGAVALYLSWALAVNPMVGDKLPLFPHPYGGGKRAA